MGINIEGGGVLLFAVDRIDSNGLRRLTLNQSALMETLIQLSNSRQYDMAESMLATCDMEQLRQLLIVAGRAFSTRMTYSLEKQWRRSQETTYKAKKSCLKTLVNIFNTWCAEGRRSAIRSVLGEMQGSDLAALILQDSLDREIYSMLREYVVPPEQTR
jgi:hypothetical protein